MFSVVPQDHDTRRVSKVAFVRKKGVLITLFIFHVLHVKVHNKETWHKSSKIRERERETHLSERYLMTKASFCTHRKPKERHIKSIINFARRKKRIEKKRKR